MSSRLAPSLQGIPARTFSTPRAAKSAQFSRCARQLNREAKEPVSPTKERESKDKDRNDGQHTQSRRGFAVPAFLLFVVGAPLGWYLQTHYNQSSYMRTASPSDFVRYKLVGKDTVSSTCAIFKLRPATNLAIDLDQPALERALTSVEFKQPQLQIARSYTCLPQEQGQHMDELRFLIRREQKGEVSNFLHRLSMDSEIEVRGVKSEYTLPDNLKSAIFLVGGTGIAPAMQAVDIVDGQADVHVLWASRKREDCTGGHSNTIPAKRTWSWWSAGSSQTTGQEKESIQAERGILVTMLDNLKRQTASSAEKVPRLLVEYYVDEEGTFVKPEDVSNALRTLPRHDQGGRKILFVSGPQGFINHWAGPKQWANGTEVQGPLRGVLSTLDLNGWEVVKL